MNTTAKSLVIPAIYTKFNLTNLSLNFVYMAGITSDLAKNPETPRGGSPDDFRRDNIAGPHGMYR